MAVCFNMNQSKPQHQFAAAPAAWAFALLLMILWFSAPLAHAAVESFAADLQLKQAESATAPALCHAPGGCLQPAQCRGTDTELLVPLAPEPRQPNPKAPDLVPVLFPNAAKAAPFIARSPPAADFSTPPPYLSTQRLRL